MTTLSMDQAVVKIGKTVKVKMPDSSEKTFTIRHSKEADPAIGIISDECPIGKALVGSRKGDAVTYKVMDRTFTVEVIEVS